MSGALSRTISTCVAAFVVLTEVAVAAPICSDSVAKSTAGEIQRGANVLIETTSLECVPTREKDGHCGVFCSTIYSMTDQQRTVVLGYLVAMAGMTMRKHDIHKYSSILYIDRDLAQSNSGLIMSAADAGELQQSVHDGHMSAEDYISAVRFRFRTITRKQL